VLQNLRRLHLPECQHLLLHRNRWGSRQLPHLYRYLAAWRDLRGTSETRMAVSPHR
jgi:hypothetical protein